MGIKEGRVLLLLFFVGFASRVEAQLSAARLNFGAKGGLNYTMIGTQYGNYNGAASPNLSMFFSYRLNNTNTLIFEPGYSGIEFRQQQNETRYSMDYIDLSFYTLLYPSESSKDLGFVLGVRPSFLIAHSTEAFLNGSYSPMSDPDNRNKNGQMDIGAIAGISLAMSPIVNLELLYSHSLSNYNTSGGVYGRPSTLEFGLRINALGFQSTQNTKQQRIHDQVTYYKKGVLLVMLSTPSAAVIQTIKDQGHEDNIPQIESAYNTNNMTIMNEFRKEFSFCPVYFYYDDDAHKVALGSTEGILVNSKLEIDSTIGIDTTHYFVASVCNDHSLYTQRMQLGLYVYDEKLNQLGKPFNPNLIDFMNDGNPLNYINGRKMPIYTPAIIRKKVRKLNARLIKLAE